MGSSGNEICSPPLEKSSSDAGLLGSLFLGHTSSEISTSGCVVVVTSEVREVGTTVVGSSGSCEVCELGTGALASFVCMVGIETWS